MIQIYVHFNGLLHEDPNWHITYFLKICDTFRQIGVTVDVIRLKLFRNSH